MVWVVAVNTTLYLVDPGACAGNLESILRLTAKQVGKDRRVQLSV